MQLKRSICGPVIAFISAFVLVGCLGIETTPQTSRGFLASNHGGFEFALNRSKKLSLAGGAIRYRPPKGYCLSDAGLKQELFALLANCRVLHGNASDAAENRGLLTISVGPPHPAAPDLATVANSMRRLGDVSTREKVIFVKINSGVSEIIPGSDARHWRAATVIGDRIVSLAAYAPPGGRLTEDDGRDILFDLAASFVAKSQLPNDVTTVSEVKPTSATPGAASERKSLLGGLFSVNGNRQQ